LAGDGFWRQKSTVVQNVGEHEGKERENGKGVDAKWGVNFVEGESWERSNDGFD